MSLYCFALSTIMAGFYFLMYPALLNVFPLISIESFFMIDLSFSNCDKIYSVNKHFFVTLPKDIDNILCVTVCLKHELLLHL